MPSLPEKTSTRRTTAPVRLACAAAFIVPFGFYFYTCAPGIGMGDTALLVEHVHFLHLSTHAVVHNVAVLIGWLFYQLPGANLAWKLNLASVFTGGAAIVLYGLLLHRVVRSRLVALACTGVLMVSHSMWWHSAIAESYAANALFTVGVLWLLFAPGGREDWRLILLFLVGALAVFNHAQMGAVVLGATVMLVMSVVGMLFGQRSGGAPRPRPLLRIWRAAKLLLLSSLAFLVGMVPWLLVFAREASDLGWKVAVFNVRGGGFRKIMFQGDVNEGVSDVLYLVFEQFPGPYLLALVPGWVILARRYGAKRFFGLATMFIVNTGFFALYDTWDRYAFLLPSFVMLAFPGALAVDALWRIASHAEPRSERRSVRVLGQAALIGALLFSVAFPPWFYSKLAAWGRQPGVWSLRYPSTRSWNLLDFAEYRANPNKRHWNDAEEYANLLFYKLPRNATYIGDDSRAYYSVQYFRRFYRRRPDLKVFVINTWGISNWGLDRKQFRKKLQYAYDNNRKLFIPSLGYPYKKFLPLRLGSKKPVFQPFVLDERRYVHRLLTKRNLERHRP